MGTVRARVGVAASALFALVALAGCGVAIGGTPGPAGSGGQAGATVTATGYALAPADQPAAPVAIRLNLAIAGVAPTATWGTLQAAVQAAERALREAGAPAGAIAAVGPPSLSAQVGAQPIEASQTVSATLDTEAAALQVVAHLQISTLAGYDGYYLAPVAAPRVPPSQQVRADAAALRVARSRAVALAKAQGLVLGALRATHVDILTSTACGPVNGCTSDAAGAIVPTPGPGQVLVAVTATYATRRG